MAFNRVGSPMKKGSPKAISESTENAFGRDFSELPTQIAYRKHRRGDGGLPARDRNGICPTL
jgi:hypothetical protein